MLEPVSTDPTANSDEKAAKPKMVNCFVCKQQVDQASARQVTHSKEKKVWVCEAHLKK